jgi:hypothetical protein
MLDRGARRFEPVAERRLFVEPLGVQRRRARTLLSGKDVRAGSDFTQQKYHICLAVTPARETARAV